MEGRMRMPRGRKAAGSCTLAVPKSKAISDKLSTTEKNDYVNDAVGVSAR